MKIVFSFNVYAEMRHNYFDNPYMLTTYMTQFGKQPYNKEPMFYWYLRKK